MEQENLEILITGVAAALHEICPFEIIFVDDSADDSPTVLKTLSEKYESVRYLHRDNERGLATAVVRGFEIARGDVIAVMDADLQHPPELLPVLYQEICNGADVVLASRFLDGGNDEGLSAVRSFMSLMARSLGKLLLKPLRKISDPTGGYFMMQRSVIEGVVFKPLGWKILMEVLVLGHYQTVTEVAYSFHARHAGGSKLSTKVMLQYLAHLVSLFLRGARNKK